MINLENLIKEFRNFLANYVNNRNWNNHLKKVAIKELDLIFYKFTYYDFENNKMDHIPKPIKYSCFSLDDLYWELDKWSSYYNIWEKIINIIRDYNEKLIKVIREEV